MRFKETLIGKALIYPFSLIVDIFKSLSMDDKGFSLKKILASFSTYEAARFTEQKLESNNVIIMVIVWLVYAGILVGIYSITDISNAVGKIKEIKTQKDETKTS